MRCLILVCTLVVSALALPTEYLVREPPTEYGEAVVLNGTRFTRDWRQMGFSTVNGGTRGGDGGATWTVWDAWALRDAVAGNDRRMVYVRGRIDLTVLFTGSPGVFLVVGANKSIYGGDNNAMIYGGGLKTHYSHQLILYNLKIHNALSYAPGEQPNGNGGIISQVPGAFSQVDGLDIEATDHVFVAQCEFADDPWVSSTIPENRRRHDGLIDIKVGSSFITIHQNIFRNHNLVTLVGHSDGNAAQDIGRLKVTFNANWYMGTTQRNPRVRYGEVHVLNNLYTDISDYGIGAGAGALIYAERNVFINTPRGWAFPSGTPNPMGYLLGVDNMFQNSHFSTVPSDQVRWRPSQYYGYTPLAVGNVERHVRTFAGII